MPLTRRDVKLQQPLVGLGQILAFLDIFFKLKNTQALERTVHEDGLSDQRVV